MSKLIYKLMLLMHIHIKITNNWIVADAMTVENRCVWNRN